MDQSVLDVIYKINKAIINPLILFLFALAMIYFIWGVYRYWIAGSPEEHTQGSRHILWSIVGMVIMIGVFTIIHFIMNTIGVSNTPPTIQ